MTDWLPEDEKAEVEPDLSWPEADAPELLDQPPDWPADVPLALPVPVVLPVEPEGALVLEPEDQPDALPEGAVVEGADVD